MDSFLVNAAGGGSSNTSSSSSRSIIYNATAPAAGTTTPLLGSIGCQQSVGCSFTMAPSEDFVQPGILHVPSFTIPLGAYIGVSGASASFSISAFVGYLSNRSSSGYSGDFRDGHVAFASHGSYVCSASHKPTVKVPEFYVIWSNLGRLGTTYNYGTRMGIESALPNLAFCCIAPSNGSSDLAAYQITSFSITAELIPIQSLLPSHP